MWPHKKGLGTNLTYGVSGNGNLELGRNDRNGPNPVVNIKFPRIRNEGLNLHEVKHSYECLAEGENVLAGYNKRLQCGSDLISRDPTNTKGILKNSAYVPEEIVRSFLVESNSLMSPEVFDPTFGELFTMIYFKSSRKKVVTPALAYVTNENILNVSVFKKQSREMRTSSLESNMEHRTLTPRLSQPFQASFSQPIKQVVSSFNSNLQNSTHVYLLVRTDYQVYILDCRSQHIDKNNTNVELNVLVEINSNMHLGINFADASFDKNNCRRIVIVDIKGNVGIWEFLAKDSEAFLKKVPLNSQLDYKLLIGEVNELSSWKKIVTGSQSGQYFVCSRTSLVFLDISKDIKKHDIVSAKSWSRILDLSHTLKQSYLFLLTSKEIIWIDTSSGVKRLLSWKHYLDDRNPSWKIAVKSLKDGNHIICLVYSRVSPIIFVYNFGIIDNKPCSLKDPYFIRSGNTLNNLENDSLGQVSLMDLSEELYDSQSLELQRRLYILFELTTGSSLSYRLFSDVKGLNMKMAKKNGHLTLSKSSEVFSNTHKATYFNLFTKKEFEPIAESLRCPNGLIFKFDQIDELEKYALEISELISTLKKGQFTGVNAKMVHGYHSLDCLMDYVPVPRENIEEFGHMLEELFKYNIGNLKLKNFMATSVLSYNRLFESDDLSKSIPYKNTEVTPISLYSSFRDLSLDTFRMPLDSESLWSKISILLSLSLIKIDLFEQRNLFVDQYENILKETSSRVLAVTDKWETDYNEPENIETSMTQELPNDFVTSSMPSIKVTNSNGQREKTRYTSQTPEERPEDNQVVLMSQPVSSSELTIAQHRQKRSLDRFNENLATDINKNRIPFLLNSGTRKPKKKKRQGGFA